jgi:PelA/Pel-15E family pectate lyase
VSRIGVATLAIATSLCAAPDFPIARREILRQSTDWYASSEARALAGRILALQGPQGGWSNWSNEVGMTQFSAPIEEKNITPQSLDDGATTTQMKILARVLTAPPTPALSAGQADTFRRSFLRGFEYLLKAQYPNGGWPHRFPAKGYHAHITFNDDTTYNVITLLRSIIAREPPYGWLDDGPRKAAASAVDRGIACILACQVVQDGKKTVWGAQHDAKTLAPAPARTFEPASLCGQESAGIVRLLMAVEKPSPEIIEAVRGAVAWFEQVKITGLRVERFQTPEGWDTRAIQDPAAPALWARFYELGTNRPIFSGRDAVIKYTMAEIERERRGGYGWYSDRPRALLETDYPRWAATWLKR